MDATRKGAKVSAHTVSKYLSSAGHNSIKSSGPQRPRRHRRGDGTIEVRTSMDGRMGGFLSRQDGDDTLVRFVGSSAREEERLAECRRILENCNLAVTYEKDDDPERAGRNLLRVSSRRS